MVKQTMTHVQRRSLSTMSGNLIEALMLLHRTGKALYGRYCIEEQTGQLVVNKEAHNAYELVCTIVPQWDNTYRISIAKHKFRTLSEAVQYVIANT